jgi:uncharacterized protein YukE
MKKRLEISLLVLVLVATAGLLWKQQALLDWWHLRGYTPPTAVAALASDDAMTPLARHLLYVNRPDITSGKNFTNNCPSGGEKTVVLGCYVGVDRGIFIYQVTDSRLSGVEQVTAAHEMLHAAYRRLSTKERTKVDAMLTDYYQHGLADQRVKDTIDAYKKTEPDDVVNEMHSIFGTEIAILPVSLQTYYQRYFTDRDKVTAYTASYQGEFTNRQMEVAADDTQLTTLKAQISTNESALTSQKARIDTQANQLQSLQASGQTSAYNSAVPAFNQAVDTYNNLLATTRNLITQYNDVVAKRNAVVLEEQQLASELSANALPASN